MKSSGINGQILGPSHQMDFKASTRVQRSIYSSKSDPYCIDIYFRNYFHKNLLLQLKVHILIWLLNPFCTRSSHCHSRPLNSFPTRQTIDKRAAYYRKLQVNLIYYLCNKGHLTSIWVQWTKSTNSNMHSARCFFRQKHGCCYEELTCLKIFC